MRDESNLFNDDCTTCGQIPTYADDSTVVLTTRNRFQSQERLNTIIDRVKIFLAANSLSLNLGKTEIVEVMVRQKRVRLPGLPPQLSVTNSDGSLKIILAKEYCHLLGANIGKDATWQQHLETGEKPVFKTLRSTLGALTHLSKYMSTKCRLLLANGLFLSKLLYLLPMWGGLKNKDMKTVQVLLNKCARMVLGVGRKTRTRALMIGCNWLYVKELIEYHSTIQLFKTVNTGKPTNLRNKIQVLPDKKITAQNACLKTAGKSFRFRTIRTWNELPVELTNIEKLSVF